MAWTVPIRWTVNQIVTAALLNTHLRDNLNASETATVTTAADLVYATAKNTLTRLAAGSARTALTVASGGTAPEWTHSFYPIKVSTLASTLLSDGTSRDVWGFNAASYLGANDAVFIAAFCTYFNNANTCAELNLALVNTAANETIGYWIPIGASHSSNTASRGGWYYAWLVGKTSTCQRFFMIGPRNASAMPLLGAITDMYLVENSCSTATSGCIAIRGTSGPGASADFTLHFVGAWRMRSI
jgi:hypothetical protein